MDKVKFYPREKVLIKKGYKYLYSCRSSNNHGRGKAFYNYDKNIMIFIYTFNTIIMYNKRMWNKREKTFTNIGWIKRVCWIFIQNKGEIRWRTTFNITMKKRKGNCIIVVGLIWLGFSCLLLLSLSQLFISLIINLFIISPIFRG